MKTTTFLILFLLAYCGFAQSTQRIKVSDNHRFLVYEDGTPFFWLGDTGWELFHRLDREKAEKYLKTRAEQGYTVIQAVALAEENGLLDPNPYGEIPLLNTNPATPNEKYFQHVDYIIDLAAKYNLVIALLPTWGDKIDKMQWGQGPVVFNTENAKMYGQWIGNRYKNKTNVIWINGGDREPKTETIPVYEALAQGIIAGVGNSDKVLMTFHPVGGSTSSTWFHNSNWLNFNMMQTGHCKDVNVYTRIAHDYNLKPTKPVLDGEPIYEDHPVCFDSRKFGYSKPIDLRKSAYWGVFAGGFGHTYGCHDVWQMFDPERMPVNNPRRPWYDALQLPGATQMQYLKNLMLSRSFLSRIPDQTLVLSSNEGSPEYIAASRDISGSYAFIYFSVGKKATINTNLLSGKKIIATWYNPQNGEKITLGEFAKTPTKEFTPPTLGIGNDWVLILDDSSKK